MAEPAKVLVVDDEASIRLFLEEMLTRDGHCAVVAENGEQALRHLAAEEFDLVLLDLRLPGIDGIQVLSALRERSPESVAIVLTGYGSLETAVDALRHGAHDYLFKPVKTVELRESVRTALLKRRRNLQQRALMGLTRQLIENLEDDKSAAVLSVSPGADRLELTEEAGRFIKHGSLIVDSMRHIVTLGGQVLEFSPTEFALVAYLTSESPRVVSPQELVRAVQGYTCQTWEASEMLRYHIHRIRQKIKSATGQAEIIRTVRGVGYTLSP